MTNSHPASSGLVGNSLISDFIQVGSARGESTEWVLRAGVMVPHLMQGVKKGFSENLQALSRIVFLNVSDSV